MNKHKLFAKAVAGRDIRFEQMITLVEAFGFTLDRINGSHHIFKHPAVPERLNLQSKGGKAKSYQVSQFVQLVEMYNLQLED